MLIVLLWCGDVGLAAWAPPLHGGRLRAGKRRSAPVVAAEAADERHIVLVGGGHAHVQVIKALNAAARVSLIEPQLAASCLLLLLAF